MRTALEQVKKENEKKEMFVPLAPSLYALGTMEDTEKVIVDIGTGFYVEKTVEDAKAFIDRKKEHVRKQIVDCEGQMEVQMRNVEQVTLVLQQKTAAKK